MLKFFREKLLGVLKSRKGANEIVAIVLILVFVILVVAPQVKNLGNTMSDGVGTLNQQLEAELGL